MKKIVAIIVASVLLLAGCGTSQPAKTEEELRAEVKAELEAEMAAEAKGEAPSTEEAPSAEEDQAQSAQADIHNKEKLIVFLMDNVEIQPDFDAKDIEEHLKLVYGDFNGDGQDEVICYANTNNVFPGTTLVGIVGDSYGIIESPLDLGSVYTKEYVLEGDFIKCTSTGGGTGLSVKGISIFKVEDDKIIDTGLTLTQDYGESQRPTSDYPDGYVRNGSGFIEDRSYKIASQDDKWLQVYYKYTLIDGNDDSLLLETEDIYTYDQNKQQYVVEQFNPPIVNGAAYGQASLNKDSKYDLQRLMPGQLIEGNLLKNAFYNDNSGAGFEIDCNKEVIGKITYDEYFEEYTFGSDTKVIEHPVYIKTPFSDQSWDVYGPERAYISEEFLNALSDEDKKQLKDNKSLDVKLTLVNFSKTVMFESTGGESIKYKHLEVLSNMSGEEIQTGVLSASTSIDPNDIVKDQTFGGFKVDSIDYQEGKQIELILSGDKSVKGSFEYADHDGSIRFVTNEKWLDKPIVYKFESGFENKIDTLSAFVNTEKSRTFDLQEMNYLKTGNKLQAEIRIKGISIFDRDESEGYTSISFDELQIIADETFIVFVEGNNGKKVSGLKTEIFTREENGPIEVNYNDYRCVVIPMQTSTNESLLSENSQHIKFTETGKELKFAVFGEIQDVKLNYVSKAGEEGEWKEIDLIKNGLVLITADLPSDSSSVSVQGRFHDGEGYYKDVSFTLDDARDTNAYNPILFE